MLMRKFQDIQKASIQKCQEFVLRAKEIAQSNETTLPIQDTDEGGEDEPFVTKYPSVAKCPLLTSPSQLVFRQQQQKQELLGLENEISYNQALIQEREQGILEIETAMADVHELFTDLGLLVGDQQGMLGTLESLARINL